MASLSSTEPGPGPFADADLTEDVFLGGRLRLLQPRRGYRAATDPVLLAAAVPARPGESVLDLGCGAGTASLCLGWRVAGLRLHGVELQPAYADLARRNAARSGIALEVTEADIRTLPAALRARSFDHVVANPPWYPPDGPAAADPGRAIALQQAAPTAAWVDAGLRRLKPGGRLSMIHLAAQLPALLAALDGRAGVSVLPLLPREGRDAGRILLQARKGGRAAFRLCAPLVLHAGGAHLQDGEDFTDQAQAILRHAAALTLD